MQSAVRIADVGDDRKPWRILFAITSSDFGGAEAVLRELALQLDPRAFETLVCSLRPTGRIASEIAAEGKLVLTLNMSDQPRATELVAGAVELARWLDAYQIDLVHSFLYRANLLARIAARLSHRRPIVVSGHHTITPLGGRAATLASRWTRGLSDRLVAASQAVRDALVSAERVRREQVVVIENGVDTRRFRECEPAPLRSQLGLRADTILIGAVGRFSPEKGLHHLLESVALVRRRGLPVHLLLVGDGPERNRLQRDSQQLHLDQHVSFLGVCRDLPPLYAAMDIFALSSLEEAAPMVLLEAMSAGRAVVTCGVGGASEMVEHERSGLLVEPASPPALAAALVRLASDPALRSQFGREAARRARERFDISRTVQRHTDLYLHLLGDAGTVEMMQSGD